MNKQHHNEWFMGPFEEKYEHNWVNSNGFTKYKIVLLKNHYDAYDTQARAKDILVRITTASEQIKFDLHQQPWKVWLYIFYGQVC